MKRKTWNNYFMDIATLVATRATCNRKHVGCVIVKRRNILSTGYNGSVKNTPHCDDIGHLMQDGHCIRTIHAEINAIVHAAKNGICINDGTMYVTAVPCFHCFRAIINAGIKEVYYMEEYRPDNNTKELLQSSDIIMTKLEVDNE